MNSITRSTWGRWPLAALLLGLLALTALLSASADTQAASSPPGRVDSVTITRANGSLTASWDAPAGATKYHITYSSDSAASWSLGAYDHTTTSLTISADNPKTYIVAVRAGNDAGWSSWRNSESSGPYTPPAPPATPTSVTVTRSDETLHVSWPAVDGATAYHITYAIASAGDRSWVAAATNHPTNSIDIKHVLNTPSYIVGVRALNDGGGSGWRNSAPTGGFLSPKPLPSPPTSVTVTRGDGTLTVSWPAAANATSYSVFLKDNSDNTWKEGALFIEQTSLSVDASNYLDYTASVRSHNGTGDSHSVDSAVSSATATLLPPASITVTRGDGTLSASWPAADGATAYHVGWSDNNGASWHRERTSYAGTSINFTVPTIDNAKSYAVNVMSVIGDVQSVWRYSDFAPPYIVATPARPASVTIVRTDGALTASWDAVQNTATYHVTYSSDGKASWSLAVYDHTRTSIEISADNAKTYFVAVRGLNSQGTGGAWRDSAPAGPYTPTPPAAPANLAVAPGNGFLGITWDAVAVATGYDVRVKPQGASNWTTVATNHANTTYNYATTTTIDHVGVRARNSDGVSDWVSVSRLPSSELLSTVTGEVSGMGGIAMAESNIASGQSEVSGQSNQVSGQSQLSAPVWGTINRTVNRQKVEIDLNWTHTGWATGFNLVCSDTDGWSWNVCGWDDDGTVSYTSVPTAESRPVKITHYRRGSDSPHTPGDYDYSKSRHYTVAIRAVNANPSQASDWVRTEIIRPIFPALRNFTSTRTDGQITMSWTPNPWTTGYKVYCDNYTSGGTYNPSYELCATLTNQSHDDATHSVTITKSGGTHNWSSLDDTSTLDIAIDSTNATGSGRWLAPLMAPPPTLTASNVAATTATLTIANHTGQWWYKANTGPDNTCKGPVASGTSTKNLTGLTTATTTYTYKAYSASGCASANELATAAPFTTGASVSNLSETEASASLNLGNDWGQEFTTGSAANGYKLQSVTLDFAIVNPSGNITVSLREQQSNNHPATTALATLTGTPAQGQVTFTCSGAGCNLNASTTYFVFVDGNEVVSNLRSTASDNETPQPSGNGWSIENAVRYQAGSWALHPQGVSMKVKIEAVSHPSLTASSVSSTGATLAISQHTGAWHYKANASPHTTCQGPVSTSSVTLSSLTAGTSYTYTAYSDSACAIPLASATFATPPGNPQSVSVGNSTYDGNTRTYPVSWQKPANTQASDTFAYQVQCTSVNDRNTTSWGACSTNNIASTANTNVSYNATHGWQGGTFKYIRVRAVKNSLYSDWVIAATQYGS